MPINDNSSRHGSEHQPPRFSLAWYEKVIPLIQDAIQAAMETERFYRMIGRQEQAALYADLVDSRCAFLDSILERIELAAANTVKPKELSHCKRQNHQNGDSSSLSTMRGGD
jgi:hypothetical protein